MCHNNSVTKEDQRQAKSAKNQKTHNENQQKSSNAFQREVISELGITYTLKDLMRLLHYESFTA